MCGFAGFLLYDKPILIDKQSVLQSMGDQIAHRGPDDHQTYITDNLGFIFRRLSIVDINGGGQPMRSEDGSIILMVNGEIYNYQDLIKSLKKEHHFKSRSDCEVLVHLYEEKGLDFLKDINGMFALALWDNKRKLFLLARDRLGIKPLYYSNSGKRLLFGSEIKALLPFPDCPASFNWFEALNGNKKIHVNDNYEVETYFHGINQLKGGQYLIRRADEREPVVGNYWSLMEAIEPGSLKDNRTRQQIIQEYHDLLSDSVGLMLLGDVEIGLFLSGGIDSTAIAALAAKRKEISTFSVFNDDTIESGDSQFASKAADALGLANYQVNITYNATVHTPSYWRNLVWQCETYECGTEQLYKFELYRYIKTQFPNLKIILLGQGSDEFNGGYAHKYVNAPHPENSNRWPEFEQAMAVMERNNLLSGTNSDLLYFQKYINREYLAHLKNSSLSASPWYQYLNMHSKGLQLYQLLHEDRTAMANSIENRVPFLDHRLVEFIVKIPPAHFPQLFWNKNILRKGMSGHIPQVFCDRPKVPFIFDNKAHHSGKIILDILTSHKEELINYALGEKDEKHEILNRQEIEGLLSRIKSDPQYRGIDELRYLVNMGLLHKKVLEKGSGEVWKPERIEIKADSFCNQDKVNYAKYQKLLKIARSSVNQAKNKVKFYLSKDIMLLTELKGSWFVFLAGDVVEIIQETNESNRNWIKVLKHARDNDRNINQAMMELNITFEDLKKAIAKSLRSKVIYKENRKYPILSH